MSHTRNKLRLSPAFSVACCSPAAITAHSLLLLWLASRSQDDWETQSQRGRRERVEDFMIRDRAARQIQQANIERMMTEEASAP